MQQRSSPRPMTPRAGARAGLRRWRFAAAAALTVILGLASRQLTWVPLWVGDLLWSTMVFFLVSVCRPSGGRWRCGAVALAISYLVEASQLYHRPWLDSIRGTAAGHLVLGSAFSWTDMVAYTAGVAAGIAVARPLIRSGQPKNLPSTTTLGTS